jgi:hypothetical protein
LQFQKLDESIEYQHPYANVPAQTVAIEEEPLDSKTSDTTRIIRTINRNHSKLFELVSVTYFSSEVPLKGRASPVEKGGKLYV